MEYTNFTLKEIANWLLHPDEVSLPVIQRGFVWKPSQIENLWDSLFRDYPIGSFMLTSEGSKKMLLDGQQRATSIALGFFNPWESEINRLGNAKNLPVLWLDVSPIDKTVNSEFVFRATTRSHPWGYQLKHNSNVLSISDRRTASGEYAKLFSKTVYTQLNANQRLPFDAHLPVPLCFLIEALEQSNGYDEWREIVLEKCKLHIPLLFRPKHLGNHQYHEVLEQCELQRYYEILSSRLKEYRIPSILVDNNLILNNTDDAVKNPTLFVRLNSAGTNLEGEELIYSIYKAVCPQTKDLVENIGNNLIAPSRIIVTATRLILAIKYGKYAGSINLIQFQKHIADTEFLLLLKELTGTCEDDSILHNLIYKAIDILKFDGSIPDVIIKKFIRDAPNGLLLLLHWLYYNKKSLSLVEKRKICSRLYRLYWFGDLDLFTKQTWIQSKECIFWETPYTNGDYLCQLPLISPESVEKFLLDRLNTTVEDHNISLDDEEIWQMWSTEYPRPESMSEESHKEAIRKGWLNFLNRLLTNRSLILLAQRHYINRAFQEFNQMEDLQDSNTPWDWDHIYPQSWVYYQQSIDERTRKWEWRIGNFRAMSLTDNRSENNNESPAARFKTTDADYFIMENDLKYWSQLTDEHKYVKKRDSDYVMIHAKAIITRTVNIYREFYSLLII